MSPPLSASERRVLVFLDKLLPDGWEIYVQPALNGLRPDFVLLHPHIGVGVIEVKNWNIASGRFSRVDRHVSGGADLFYKYRGRNIDMARSNPVQQIERYRMGILDLYCPRLGRKGVKVVFGAVIFTHASKSEGEALLQPWVFHATRKGGYQRNCVVSGAGEVARGDICACVPWAADTKTTTDTKLFGEEMASDLRSWLEESDYARESRRPLQLNSKQSEMAGKAVARMRVEGPAGSGKSILLVARAARLVREGRRVAVLTYNLALIPYLRSLAYRIPDAPKNLRQRIVWLSFHLWIRRICEDVGALDEYRSLWVRKPGLDDEDGKIATDGVALKHTLAQLIPLLVDVLKRPAAAKIRFDAILVDEGQDFDPSWISAITGALKKDGELLLVRDVTQDLYGIAEKQTEPAWAGCGFSGPWGRLKTCYRIPPAAQEKLRDLCMRFMGALQHEAPDLQLELAITPCELRWVHCPAADLALVVAEEIDRLVTKTNDSPVVYPDVIVLAADEHTGCCIDEILRGRGISATNTFTRGEWVASRRAKMAFHLSDARVKLTTIHSFKGMEARALIVVLPFSQSQHEPKLLYTALSRLLAAERGSFLTVVSKSAEYLEFGRGWPDYIEREPTQAELDAMIALLPLTKL